MRTVQRNAALYPWYSALIQTHFWLPVFFLYFSRRIDLDGVLRLEAIYYLTVVLLEVPSGYFSDRLGRRVTLITSATMLVLAYATFLLAEGFGLLAVGQVLLAAGLAFNSGTDTALHYDSLQEAGLAQEYGDREARAGRFAFLASAAAGLIGGACAVLDLRMAYLLTLVTASIALGLALIMREPTHGPDTPHADAMPKQIGYCLKQLRRPIVGYAFCFFVAMTILNHIPYEFYQPYLEELSVGNTLGPTPLITGVHTMLAMLIAAWIASRSMAVRRRIGLGPTLLSAMGLQTLIIVLMGLAVHPVIAVVTLMRSCPRALMAAPLNAAVTPRIDQAHRATFLSVQSLVGRLAFSATLVGLSWIPGADRGGWPWLSRKLLVAGALAGALLVGFVLTVRLARDRDTA
ncbi:MAG: MFS transporter [Planctomycetota bacterium]